MTTTAPAEAPWRFWGTALALMVCLGFSSSMMVAGLIASSGDDIRAREDRAMLAGALDTERVALSQRTLRIAAAVEAEFLDKARPASGRAIAASQWVPATANRHEVAFVLDQGGVMTPAGAFDQGLVDVASDPAIADLRGRLVAKANAAGPGGDAGLAAPASFLVAGATPYLIAVAPLHIASVPYPGFDPGPQAVILLDAVDAMMLGDIAAIHRLSGLRFSTGDLGGHRSLMELRDDADRSLGVLSWDRATPVFSAFWSALPYVAMLALGVLAVAALAGLQAIMATRRDQARRRRARFEAEHDALTGLINRNAFAATLARQFAGVGFFETAVLCVSIDGLREVNDTLGQPVGDDLLLTLTRRLREAIGEEGTLARLGTDGFGAMLWLSSIADASACAARIAASIRDPLIVRGMSITLDVSVGVACAPRDGRDGGELLQRAEIALAVAKSRGRSEVALFDMAMERDIQNRKLVEHDLRAALLTDEIHLAYQPIFSSDGSHPIGVEALLRWNHPVRGPIPPSEFIPIAEETGLIRRLGAWALEEACRTAVRWDPLFISVNLSPVQMRSQDVHFSRGMKNNNNIGYEVRKMRWTPTVAPLGVGSVRSS